jgi:hypothetical protein
VPATRRCIIPPEATIMGTASVILRKKDLGGLTAGWRLVVATRPDRREAVAWPPSCSSRLRESARRFVIPHRRRWPKRHAGTARYLCHSRSRGSCLSDSEMRR